MRIIKKGSTWYGVAYLTHDPSVRASADPTYLAGADVRTHVGHGGYVQIWRVLLPLPTAFVAPSDADIVAEVLECGDAGMTRTIEKMRLEIASLRSALEGASNV